MVLAETRVPTCGGAILALTWVLAALMILLIALSKQWLGLLSGCTRHCNVLHVAYEGCLRRRHSGQGSRASQLPSRFGTASRVTLHPSRVVKAT